jgi:hypothetical protein
MIPVVPVDLCHKHPAYPTAHKEVLFVTTFNGRHFSCPHLALQRAIRARSHIQSEYCVALSNNDMLLTVERGQLHLKPRSNYLPHTGFCI